MLITIGEHARIMAEHSVKLGFNAPVYSFKNSILAYKLLHEIVDTNTIVLVKGDMYSKALHELATKLKNPSFPSE